MGIKNEELNLLEIFRDLGTICKTPSVCGGCAEEACLIGYAKVCASKCRTEKKTFVEEGVANIPAHDIRGGYDEYTLLHAIAHLLKQCKGCKEDHFDNCIISVIRNCLELIEFGDEQDYEGIPFMYLMKLQNKFPQKSHIISEEYNSRNR